MKKLGSFWQKLIIWLTGYLNIIAFIVGGGYVYLKTDDEEIKGSAKLTLLLVAGFTGLDIFYSLIYNILTIFGAGYDTLSDLTIVQRVFALAKIIAFVVLFILDAMGKIDKLKTRLREPAAKVPEDEENPFQND